MYGNRFEVVPPPDPHLQFPGGDIEPAKAQRAYDYLDEIAADTVDEAVARLSVLRLVELGRWRSLPGQRHEAVFEQATGVVKQWAADICPDDERASAVAAIGLHQTLAFNTKTRLLPMNIGEAIPALQDLKELGHAQVFESSQTNWANMSASHPNVFAALSRWHAYLTETLAVSDEREHLLMASVGLPYALAVNGRMRGYLMRNPDQGAELLIRKMQTKPE